MIKYINNILIYMNGYVNSLLSRLIVYLACCNLSVFKCAWFFVIPNEKEPLMVHLYTL